MTVQHMDQLAQKPGEQYRDIIQEVFLRILSGPKFPVSARLFSMVCFCREADFLMSSDNPGLRGNLLGQEVNRVAGYVYERQWMEEFQEKSMNPELPMSMIQSLCLGMVQKCGPEFREMILAAWAEYILETGDETKGHPETDAHQSSRRVETDRERPAGKLLNIFDVDHSGSASGITCSSITGMYEKRRNHLYQVLGPELEGQMEFFCINAVLTDDHSEYGSLFAYVQRMLLGVTLMKYFMVSDPEMADAVGRMSAARASIAPVWDKERQALEKAVANLSKRIADNLAREEKSIVQLGRALMEQGMRDIGHTATWIRF